ncbi:MAG: hypothetical protein IKW57_02660 [Alphaproteobacteria bacterium]|nr:hypothetical protein [Alphaproteobacteria bacterium]
MNDKIVIFLRAAFPFLLTVGLWRLVHPIWNPGGILAIIPIFFCTFIKPIDYFLIFSILMCVCLDYSFETVCFWLALYCFCFALNGFQNFVDLTRMDFDGVAAFMTFLGIVILIQIFTNFTWINIANGFWIFILTTTIYRPCVWAIKKVHK